MDQAQLHVIGELPGSMRLGRFRNVVICAWRGQASAEAVALLTRIMVDLHAGSSELRSYIHLIPDQAGLPDPEARRGISAIMSKHEPYIACVGVVIAGTGFWASAMRSAVSGLRLLLRTPFEYRLHGHTDELLDWLPGAHFARTGVAVSKAELALLLAQATSWQS